MANPRVPRLNRVRAKGRSYIYHRASGRPIKAAEGTPEFLAEVAAAEASIKEAPKAIPGTLGLVIKEYRKSPFWKDLRPTTQRSYERAMLVMEPLNDMPLIEFVPVFVAALRDRVAETRGRWMANYVLTVLALLFDFARERDWIKENPVRKVRRVSKKSDAPVANRPWSPAECRVVLDAAPPYMRAAIALAMCAGLRKRDVLTAPKSAIKGDMIEVRTSKRGRMVRFPLHPALKAALAAAPEHMAKTLVANSRGEAWTESGFSSTFYKFVNALERDGKVEPGLTFHGLRHTVGTRLKEAGADDRAIADLLGQSSLAMANHYSKSADTSVRDRKPIEATDIFGIEKRAELATSPAKPLVSEY